MVIVAVIIETTIVGIALVVASVVVVGHGSIIVVLVIVIVVIRIRTDTTRMPNRTLFYDELQRPLC